MFFCGAASTFTSFVGEKTNLSIRVRDQLTEPLFVSYKTSISLIEFLTQTGETITRVTVTLLLTQHQHQQSQSFLVVKVCVEAERSEGAGVMPEVPHQVQPVCQPSLPGLCPGSHRLRAGFVHRHPHLPHLLSLGSTTGSSWGPGYQG